jgi:hypothetical protein
MAEATPKAPRKTATKTVKTEAPAKAEAKKPAAPKKSGATASATAESKSPVAQEPVVVAAKPATAPAAAETHVKPEVVAKTPAPKQKASAKKPQVGALSTPKGREITDEERYRMIAEAAYYRAESCQFKSDPIRDWIDAEKDIAILLSEN